MHIKKASINKEILSYSYIELNYPGTSDSGNDNQQNINHVDNIGAIIRQMDPQKHQCK